MDPQEKALYTAIVIVTSAIAVILLVFVLSIIWQQRRYRKLAKAKIKAEILTLENERRRIASDLHDEVGPLLSAIKIQVNHLQGQSIEEQTLIEKSSRHIDDVIRKMREISNDLLPNVLVRKGLAAAIQDFIGKVPDAARLAIHFEARGDQRPAASIEVNLYRIVQEIVHNTIKHAKASDLNIQLIITDSLVRLATEENGIGFDYYEMLRKTGGLGLLNLQSRAEVMGGVFTFNSSKGKGTKYLFEIPQQKAL
jgi:signal transduction histidine kinase